MLKTSRWWSFLTLNLLNWVFPPSIKFDRGRIVKKKTESLIFFWDKRTETLFVKDITNFDIDTGIIWDTLTIDTRGGQGILKIKGIPKGLVFKFQDVYLKMRAYS